MACATFASADYVSGLTVFYIGGNKCRLIAAILRVWLPLKKLVGVIAVRTKAIYARHGND